MIAVPYQNSVFVENIDIIGVSGKSFASESKHFFRRQPVSVLGRDFQIIALADLFADLGGKRRKIVTETASCGFYCLT